MVSLGVSGGLVGEELREEIPPPPFLLGSYVTHEEMEFMKLSDFRSRQDSHISSQHYASILVVNNTVSVLFPV